MEKTREPSAQFAAAARPTTLKLKKKVKQEEDVFPWQSENKDNELKTNSNIINILEQQLSFRETASGETASGETASGETASGETASGETASGETAYFKRRVSGKSDKERKKRPKKLVPTRKNVFSAPQKKYKYERYTPAGSYLQIYMPELERLLKDRGECRKLSAVEALAYIFLTYYAYGLKPKKPNSPTAKHECFTGTRHFAVRFLTGITGLSSSAINNALNTLMSQGLIDLEYVDTVDGNEYFVHPVLRYRPEPKPSDPDKSTSNASSKSGPNAKKESTQKSDLSTSCPSEGQLDNSFTQGVSKKDTMPTFRETASCPSEGQLAVRKNDTSYYDLNGINDLYLLPLTDSKLEQYFEAIHFSKLLGPIELREEKRNFKELINRGQEKKVTTQEFLEVFWNVKTDANGKEITKKFYWISNKFTDHLEAAQKRIQRTSRNYAVLNDGTVMEVGGTVPVIPEEIASEQDIDTSREQAEQTLGESQLLAFKNLSNETDRTIQPLLFEYSNEGFIKLAKLRQKQTQSFNDLKYCHVLSFAEKLNAIENEIGKVSKRLEYSEKCNSKLTSYLQTSLLEWTEAKKYFSEETARVRAEAEQSLPKLATA